MVTTLINTYHGYSENSGEFHVDVHDIRCKSTDSKPTGVPNGSSLIEMDTGKVYFFDADSSQWLEF